MTSPTPANSLYYRQFNRTSEPDKDWPVDSTWVAQHISANDHFGNFLLNSTTADILTFNQVATPFYKASQNGGTAGFSTFCVADGGFMKYDPANVAWFDPHVRFVCVASPVTQAFSSNDWTLFIVGSWETDSQDRFLQVASWDGVKFSFYQRDTLNPATGPNPINGLIGWTYQGSSFDAFDDQLSYLGPFDGHVNGAALMKELHKPWLHWQSQSNNELQQCFSPETIAQLQKADFISAGSQGSGVLSNVIGGDILEPTITIAINKWMQSRKLNDFWVNKALAPSVKIQRWIAHVLLTTTVNIDCGITQGSDIAVPIDFFANIDVLGNLATGAFTGQIAVPTTAYDAAVSAMQLSLLQEIGPANDCNSISIYQNLPADKRVTLYQGTLGGGKQTEEHNVTLYAIAQSGEGFGPFTFLQASQEDTSGVASLQNAIIGKVAVLTPKTLQCLLMVDPWNPVYSWRRGVLMQYCPATTTLTGKTYDVDQVMVAAITKSSYASVVGSPENQFLQWYNNYNLPNMQQAISNYSTAIKNRLKKNSSQAVADWMLLAESRRRIYRPLPLDEFGFTLPFALKYPGATDLVPYEMLQDATISKIPSRGVQFLSEWTGTLWTYNPVILPTFNTSSTLSTKMDGSAAPTAAWTLPGKGKALASCENKGDKNQPRQPRACPARSSTKRTAKKSQQVCPVQTGAKIDATKGGKPQSLDVSTSLAPSVTEPKMQVVAAPVWTDILALFQKPYWVSNPTQVGQDWQGAMKYYGNYSPEGKEFDLWNQDIVQSNIKNIYDHVRGRSMPITNDPQQYWPDEALEMLRSWANQGFRVNQNDPVKPKIVIPAPSDPRPLYRLRKDIRSLSESEINTFRAKLDDVLGCMVLNSKWQELCNLHGQWCLHYQEAFTLWHRAYLRYVEDLIDFPIPYWNTCDPALSDPTSPAAGLPQAFLDITYKHPLSGEIRPNPLRFALALDGVPTVPGQPPYIARDPILVANDRASAEFKSKVAYWKTYQGQYSNALDQKLFSYPQDVTTGAGRPYGTPWANPLTFSQMQPDALYKYSNQAFPYTPNFDGFFEQVHDNGHGWVGGVNGDMSDNGRTAADPMFLVYHANLDRILDAYLSTHPQTMYTSNYPLRPFIQNASSLDYDDFRSFMFTTLGDMAKDTRSIGYIYAPPFADNGNDLLTAYVAAQGGKKKPQVSGGTAIISHPTTQAQPANGAATSPAAQKPSAKPSLQFQPMISFPNIKCTADSYTIDMFTHDAKSTEPCHLTNKDFIGRLTRLGMGAGNESNPSSTSFKRCRRSPITRSLVLDQLSTGTGPNDALVEKIAKYGFQQVVTNLSTGKVLAKEEWEKMDGFTGHFGVGYMPAE